MDWIEKVGRLKTDQNIDEMIRVCYFSYNEPVKDIKQLDKICTFLPDDYKNFFTVSNGAQFDMFVIFGLDTNAIVSIFNEIELWKDIYSQNEWLPIGKDASGNPFLLNANGKIYVGSIDPPGEPYPLCDSFSELLSDVFMGKGYFKYMNGNVEENQWYEFLNEQGWG